MSSNLKTVLRIGGIIIALMGVMCLPSPNRAFDKGDLSTFENWADLGAFVHVGLGLIVVGLVVFVSSFLVRGGDLTD